MRGEGRRREREKTRDEDLSMHTDDVISNINERLEFIPY
jgi:hypothetical protein